MDSTLAHGAELVTILLGLAAFGRWSVPRLPATLRRVKAYVSAHRLVRAAEVAALRKELIEAQGTDFGMLARSDDTLRKMSDAIADLVESTEQRVGKLEAEVARQIEYSQMLLVIGNEVEITHRDAIRRTEDYLAELGREMVALQTNLGELAAGMDLPDIEKATEASRKLEAYLAAMAEARERARRPTPPDADTHGTADVR